MPLIAAALLLAQLVTVPAPNGAPIETDPAFRRALEVLASLDDDGRALVQVFADGGVRIVVVQDAPRDRLALYEPGRRQLSVAEEVAHVAPGTLATLLAHEASHVQTYASGLRAEEVRARGRVEACYADELRAALVELSYWQMVHPPDGKPAPAHDYEDWLNVELAAYLRDPDGYPADVRDWHADLCEPTS